MSQNGNGLPKPEPLWIALGIVVAAMAESLSPRRRALFFAALRTLTDEHEARSRVVVFGSARNHRRDLPQSVRVAIAWLRRLIVELDDGAGR